MQKKKKKKKKCQGIFTLYVRRQKQAMCAGTGPGWMAPASFWLMISEIVREEEELKCTQQVQSRWDFTEFWLVRSWRSTLRVGGAPGFCGWTDWHTQGSSLGNMETRGLKPRKDAEGPSDQCLVLGQRRWFEKTTDGVIPAI